MAQLAESLRLELTHTLARDVQHPPHLLERAAIAVNKPVAVFEQLAFAGV